MFSEVLVAGDLTCGARANRAYLKQDEIRFASISVGNPAVDVEENKETMK